LGAVGVVMIAAAFMAAACSSSSKSSTSPTTASAGSAPGSSATTGSPASTGAAAPGETIKIGYICSCTGPLASSVAVNKRAYQAWVDATNDAGGINGHKIQLFTEDDASNPAKSITQIHTLIDSDHVIAIAAVDNSPGAWAPYIKQKGVPVVGTDGAQFQYFSDPLFYYPGQTDDSLPASVVLGAKKVGGKKLAIIYCSESPACQQLVQPEKDASAKYGVPLAYSTGVSASAPNYTAQCLAAQQSGADVLFIADAVSVVESVAKDCNAQGYKPWVLASDGAVGSAFNKSPGLSDHFLSFQPQVPFFVNNTPATQAMIAAFNKYEPGLINDPNYNGEVVEAWTSGVALAEALKKGGLTPTTTPTSQMIMAGLNSFNGETLGGLAPPLTWKAGTPHLVDCWFWMGTSKGQFTLPFGSQPDCVPGTA
jgi:branched-chain amino acid transport system substrate-binding protein